MINHASFQQETLIEPMERFECLWNVSSKSFKDNKAKENAWKAVAKEVRNANKFVERVGETIVYE